MAIHQTTATAHVHAAAAAAAVVVLLVINDVAAARNATRYVASFAALSRAVAAATRRDSRWRRRKCRREHQIT